MGSGGVHKSLGRFRLMISIRRNTGNVRDHRVKSTRSFGVAMLAILAWLLPSLANSAIVHEETLINDSVDLFVSSIAVNSVAGGTDQLYIAAVAHYGDGSGVSVSSISGGSGLTWALQKTQCSERLTRMRVEVWQAFGSPGASFNVDVTLTGGTAVTTVAVSRYSGADSTTPTEGAAGANTGGQNGACPGTGTDDVNASLSLTSSQNDSVLYVATHPRNTSITTPDAAYTERAFNTTNSDGGNGAFLYVHDRDLATAGTDSADHTLNATKSWDMAGPVINPAAASGGLLAQYWVDEAASGQVPASLADNAATPLNLPLTYVASSPVWADGTGGNRHLRFTGAGDTTDTGGAVVDTDTTKIDAIHGATQATLVAKYAMDSNVCTTIGERVFGISDGDGSSNGWFAMRERLGRDTLMVRWVGIGTYGAYALGNGTPSCPIDSVATVHWVVDTTQGVAADRVRAYIDGVAATVQVMNGALPPLNATIDLGTGTRRMFLGRPHTGFRTFRGRVWYAALYDSALSAATVASDATAINACDDLGGCLVGHWNFDEGTGQIAGDVSGNLNDGTLGPTTSADAEDPTWACVTGGNALEFDGTDDYVDIPPIGDGYSAITVSAWMKAKTFASENYNPIVAREEAGGTLNDVFALMARDANEGNEASFRIYVGAGNTKVTARSGINLSTDTWYHLVGTYDGADVRVYLDGIEKGNTAQSGTLSTEATRIALGRFSNNDYVNFDGLIDEVRI